jgi:tetratricopeptide (TPR) repeat protein
MAGAYTDNQPDFSWLQPYETKSFSQFWYPIQKIGPAKNASTEAAVNLEFDGEQVSIGVCVTSKCAVRVLLTRNLLPVFVRELELAPGEPFTASIEQVDARPDEFELSVFGEDGCALIAYRPENHVVRELPGPATEPPPPEEIRSNDELYLTGVHLEQYRHATRSPETYWREGLKRDPDDARINNAMGLRSLRAGKFAEAEEYFERAIRRLTARNPNPYDGEAFYSLGLLRLYQGKTDRAYDAFHRPCGIKPGRAAATMRWLRSMQRAAIWQRRWKTSIEACSSIRRACSPAG